MKKEQSFNVFPEPSSNNFEYLSRINPLVQLTIRPVAHEVKPNRLLIRGP